MISVLILSKIVWNQEALLKMDDLPEMCFLHVNRKTARVVRTDTVLLGSSQFILKFFSYGFQISLAVYSHQKYLHPINFRHKGIEQCTSHKLMFKTKSPHSEVIRILSSKEKHKTLGPWVFLLVSQCCEQRGKLVHLWFTLSLFGKRKENCVCIPDMSETCICDVVTLRGHNEVKQKTGIFWNKLNPVWKTNSRHEF
jgi:hypothetical protein